VLPPSEAIREELRRQAAQVQVPDGMWDQIRGRLEAERRRQRRRRQCVGRLRALTPVWGAALVTGAIGLVVLFGSDAEPQGAAIDAAWAYNRSFVYARPPQDYLRAGYFYPALEQGSVVGREQSPQSGRFLIAE